MGVAPAALGPALSPGFFIPKTNPVRLLSLNTSLTQHHLRVPTVHLGLRAWPSLAARKPHVASSAAAGAWAELQAPLAPWHLSTLAL